MWGVTSASTHWAHSPSAYAVSHEAHTINGTRVRSRSGTDTDAPSCNPIKENVVPQYAHVQVAPDAETSYAPQCGHLKGSPGMTTLLVETLKTLRKKGEGIRLFQILKHVLHNS
jgi:hypothetical protein